MGPLVTGEVRKLARKFTSQGGKESIISLFFFFFSLSPLIFSFILFFSLIATDRGTRSCTSKISSSTKRDSDSSCYLRFVFWFMRSPWYQVENQIKNTWFWWFPSKGNKGHASEDRARQLLWGNPSNKGDMFVQVAPQIAHSLKLEIPGDKEAK